MTSSDNAFVRFLKTHYGDTTYRHTADEIERDKLLLPFLPLAFSRYLLLPASVLIQFCAGSLYAWSVYNIPLEKQIYGRVTNTAAITFYIAVGCFGIAAALMGPVVERGGPRRALMYGSTLFFLGNGLAALAVHFKQMWLVFVGYGIVGGAGLGMSYISPVSALQKWFPDLRGLASGLAVCGFGAGSIAASPLQLLLIARVGLAWTFVILGACYYVVMMACSVVLRVPPPDYVVNGLTSDRERVVPIARDHGHEKPDDQRLTTRQLLKTTLVEALTSREYRLIYFMFFANAVAGLVFLSRLSPMVQALFGKSPETGALVVSVNGGFNLAGRFLFGVASDRVGRKFCYLITLGVQSVLLAAMGVVMATRTYWAFLLAVWLMSSCYGATFSLIPAMLADMFGAKNIGACHGIVLTAWSVAGVGGGLIYTAVYTGLVPARYTTADAWPYEVNFLWLMCIVVAGFFVTWFIRTTDRDRLFPPAPHQLFRIRFLGRILRVNTRATSDYPRVEYLTAAREDEEWRRHLAVAGVIEHL